MKIIYCDICKKDFGKVVGYTMQMPTYKISDFDGGFNYTPKTNGDICNDCYNRIAIAQKEAIDKIKSELLSLDSKDK